MNVPGEGERCLIVFFDESTVTWHFSNVVAGGCTLFDRPYKAGELHDPV
jgi:hypothetical protein